MSKGPTTNTTQGRVIRFLADPATHDGETVEHIETHLSHVFLAGSHAYKMPKDVRLPFADFSTADLRRTACEDEFRVNTRSAPALYLDIKAVNEIGGALSLGPPTNPVEYLIHMRRFPQETLLDRMATEDRLTPDIIRGIADSAAALHLSAAHKGADPKAEDFAQTTNDLCQRLASAGAGTPLAADIDQFRQLAQAALSRHLPLIRARARHGAVRHCHGDLHLRNICLLDGQVLPFDAIAFEPRFSHIDILYDIAFAAMDLVHRGHGAEATMMLGRYLSATRDYAGLSVLRLFMAVRAGIRAMVTLMAPGPSRVEDANSYLQLGTRLLEPSSPPGLIAIGGRSGTGKSTLAFALAPRLADAPGVVILRADEIRKRLWGAPPETALPAEAYTPDVSAAVYRRMRRDAARAIRAGTTAILDASFLDPLQRDAVTSLGTHLGVPATGLWLTAPTGLLTSRLDKRTGDASDADAAVMQRQTDEDVSAPWHPIDASRPMTDTIARTLSLLNSGPDPTMP